MKVYQISATAAAICIVIAMLLVSMIPQLLLSFVAGIIIGVLLFKHI